MKQEKIPGLLGPSIMVHLDIRGKGRPRFLADVIHIKPNSSSFTFTEKGEKRYPRLRGTFGLALMVCQLPCSNFHYFHYQFQRHTMELLFAHFHSSCYLVTSNLLFNYSRESSEFSFSPSTVLPTRYLKLIYKDLFGSIQYPVLVLWSFWEKWAIYRCLLVWLLKPENSSGRA